MIGTLIGIVFLLIVCGVLWWALQRLMAIMPISEPFLTLIHVLVAVIGVFIVLYVMAELLASAGIHVAWPAVR